MAPSQWLKAAGLSEQRPRCLFSTNEFLDLRASQTRCHQGPRFLKMALMFNQNKPDGKKRAQPVKKSWEYIGILRTFPSLIELYAFDKSKLMCIFSPITRLPTHSCLPIFTLIPPTHPLHTDTTTPGTISKGRTEQQVRRDGAAFRFVYTHTHAHTHNRHNSCCWNSAHTVSTFRPNQNPFFGTLNTGESQWLRLCLFFFFFGFESNQQQTSGFLSFLDLWQKTPVAIWATDTDFPLLRVFLLTWEHQRPSQRRQRTSTIYLHPGDDKHTTWNTKQKKQQLETRERRCYDGRKREELTTARGWISSSLEELDSPLKPWGWKKRMHFRRSHNLC